MGTVLANANIRKVKTDAADSWSLEASAQEVVRLTSKGN